MNGGHYAELTAFMAIYKTRSFREASLRLDVTPSALSRTLRRLEERLGVRLLNRTTRSVSPTEAGVLLHAKLLPVIASLEQAVDDVVAFRDDAVGTVRINLSRLAAELLLLPNLAQMATLYPGVRLEMVIEDGLADVVAEGFDAGIRNGERLARDMVAVRLTSAYRNAVVGSPAYFAKHARPQTPHDLAMHTCINYRWAATGQLYRWSFEGPQGAFEVEIDAAMVCNDTGLMRDAAIGGAGLTCLPEAAVQSHIENGSLIRVLETWCTPYPGFYLYYPSRRQTLPALRALIKVLRNSEGFEMG